MSNILVAIPKGLGDSIQCLPSINKLFYHFPNHNIDVICADFLVELYRIYLPKLNVFSSQETKRYQKIEYEWFIDLASLEWSCELKEHIQYKHIAYHKFYTCQINNNFKSKIIIDNKEFHTVLFNISDTGNDNLYDKPAWSLEAEVIAKIVGVDINKWIDDNMFPRLRYKNKQYNNNTILLLPGGIGAKRKWPNEYFKELIEYLLYKGNDVDLVLGPEEIEVIPFYKNISGLTVFDNLSLVQLSKKIISSNYIITQDCGPMHLACALGKPVLAIFGPTNENCWFTYNSKHQKVIRKGKMIRSGVIKNLESWKDWPTVKEVISAIPNIYISGL
jgi:ADP-heptose:LPS heptosyltransferase